MWRVVVYLILMFALANLHQARLVLSLLPVVGAVAGEDKPQAEKGAAEKASPEGSEVSAPEEKTSDKDKKPVLSPPEVRGEGARDFLKLAEPRPLTEKQPQKKGQWGGYWGAVYRRSLDEEPEVGERESEPDSSASASDRLQSHPGEPKRTPLPEKPASLAEYKEVDFARFASGSYASDYGDKYVKLRCRFASLAPEGMRLQDFPPPGYLNFIVVGTGSSMENLTVVASMGKSASGGAGPGDRMFRIESGREITLYGRAHRLGLSGLTLVVDEIETRK
ncbi:MAG TPA: hypothetical protein ACFYEA_06150 [Candidatus Tripitaka californicus]|uniref:hypothetical protein n=1 Tax=Candidatus Tripitaka californicus TaxID=3367616 RepID=UPI00402671F3|nr:hypothetical protein [Planctomycetota bacterium]